jgi:hypothetical protein
MEQNRSSHLNTQTITYKYSLFMNIPTRHSHKCLCKTEHVDIEIQRVTIVTRYRDEDNWCLLKE